MKKALPAVLAVVIATAAYGKLGDLVASFPNPPGTSTHPCLAADAGYLYSFYWSSPYWIYRMLRSNGSLVSSYPNPFGTTSPYYLCVGFSYGGGPYLYMDNWYMRIVAKIYASNGSLVSTWTWPSGDRSGIACEHDGTNPGLYIWQSHQTGDFWRSTTTGSLLSSFTIAATDSYDLAWDYGNGLLWYGHFDYHRVYGITTKGSLVASWRVPSTATKPYGVAYYGQRLYVSTSLGTPDEYIWVYDCPNTIGVTPASVGRVKALYH